MSGQAPAVIVMAEMPGIYAHVVRFPRMVRGAGFTVWMPSLLGTEGGPVTPAGAVSTMVRACISRGIPCHGARGAQESHGSRRPYGAGTSFEGDRFCKAERFAQYEAALGDRFQARVLPDASALPGTPVRPHSVVTLHLVDRHGEPTREAVDEILGFFAIRLKNWPEASVPTDTVTLQPFRQTHLNVLAGWLEQPHVARWYPEPAANLAWAADPPMGGSQAIIAMAASDVGYLRWQRVDRDTLDTLGLTDVPANSVDADILIGNAAGIGKGVGPAALRALAAKIRRDPAVPMIGLTTELENTFAHRAFEKAGFRIARQYEVPRLGLCHLMILDLRPERGAICAEPTKP